MSQEQAYYWTFTFTIDPDLNEGYTEAFKQGNESWWWYVKDGESPIAGPVPNFTGAKFKSLHKWSDIILES
jgi:hypothetical protein